MMMIDNMINYVPSDQSPSEIDVCLPNMCLASGQRQIWNSWNALVDAWFRPA